MAQSTRVFFVDDNDTPVRVSLARFNRLMSPGSRDTLPRWAGRKARYAIVGVEVEGRKPKAVTWVQYALLALDSEGRVDRAARATLR